MAGLSREGRVERVQYWQGLIEEHSRSGLSVVEFCKERKIASASFYQWRTKLQQEAEPAVSNASQLLPVKLVSTAVVQPRSTVRSCIQVLTPSGVSLTIGGSGAEADLVRVLRAIQAAEAARSC
jgi:transposase-like protein